MKYSKALLIAGGIGAAFVMTVAPAQIAEAEKLVKEWKPDPSKCEVEAASAS